MMKVRNQPKLRRGINEIAVYMKDPTQNRAILKNVMDQKDKKV